MKVLSQQQREILRDTVVPSSVDKVNVSGEYFESILLAFRSSVKFAQ